MPLRLLPGIMPLQWRSTYYVEADESPEGGYYFDRGQVTTRIYVDHADRAQAVTDFAGSVSAQLSAGLTPVRYISRTLPHALPARPWMFVQAIPSERPHGLRGVMNEFGNGTGQSVYDVCELTLN